MANVLHAGLQVERWSLELAICSGVQRYLLLFLQRRCNIDVARCKLQAESECAHLHLHSIFHLRRLWRWQLLGGETFLSPARLLRWCHHSYCHTDIIATFLPTFHIAAFLLLLTSSSSSELTFVAGIVAVAGTVRVVFVRYREARRLFSQPTKPTAVIDE